MDEEWLVVLRCQQSLLRRAKIIAPGDILVILLQDLDGVIVGQTWEGWHDRLDLGGITLKHLELLGAVLQSTLDDVGDKLLFHAKTLLEISESHLGLDHPELDEMPPRLTLFGPESGAKAICAAKGHDRGLIV